MKLLSHVLLSVLLFVGQGHSASVVEMVRKVLEQLPEACGDQFSLCGESQGVLDMSKGNYCEAVKAAEDCSTGSKDVGVEGVCSQSDFNKIKTAACLTASSESKEEKARRKFEGLDRNCQDHGLTCLNIDAANLTSTALEAAMGCDSLEALKSCFVGNVTGDSVTSATPCTVDAYEGLKDAACCAVQLKSSAIILLLIAAAIKLRALF